MFFLLMDTLLLFGFHHGIDNKSLFRRHGRSPTGTGLKERNHVVKDSKVSLMRQFQIRNQSRPEVAKQA
jgi:hypothetical protein